MISEFAKEKVLWTEKMNMKLVKFIQSKPNIWNPKHPKYTSVAYRDKTYAEFAAKYGNAFTGHAVKDRWTNIRSTFASYLRKLKVSRAKAAKGDGEEYKVNWHLWEACQFLRKVNRRINTPAMGNGDDEVEKSDDPIKEKQDDSSDKEFSEDNLNTSVVSCKGVADNILLAFRGMQNDVFGLDHRKHGKIGRLVTEKLNQLNSVDAARVCMSITEVLYLYDQNNPMNPNNPINHNNTMNPNDPMNPNNPMYPNNPINHNDPMHPNNPINHNDPMDPNIPINPNNNVPPFL